MVTCFTSESVTEGHPDKICDQISDAILDKILAGDIKNNEIGHSRIACETLVKAGLTDNPTFNYLNKINPEIAKKSQKNGIIIVSGEITTNVELDIETIARDTVRKIGYNTPELGFYSEKVVVLPIISKQSPDIAKGVKQQKPEEQGAGDQGTMFGMATTETENLMPLPITIANDLTARLTEVRKDGTLKFLFPDGKSQVTVTYDQNPIDNVAKVIGIKNITIATHHSNSIKNKEVKEAIIEEVVKPVIKKYINEPNLSDKTIVNGTGKFLIGGPKADAGLTGRKIIVDTYGGMCTHGGGAFSGKDPSKVDRSANYFARYIAKNIVATGLASKIWVHLAYTIGKPEPDNISITTFGSEKLRLEELLNITKETFDPRPGMIIKHLGLLNPIYTISAAYGHFGRKPDGLFFPWEKTDKVETLKYKALPKVKHSNSDSIVPYIY